MFCGDFFSSRKLYLSDIARIANPKTLVNKEVYDLDLLMETYLILQQLQEESAAEARSGSPKADQAAPDIDFVAKPDQPEDSTSDMLVGDPSSQLSPSSSLEQGVLKLPWGIKLLTELSPTHVESEDQKMESNPPYLESTLNPEPESSAGVETGDKIKSTDLNLESQSSAGVSDLNPESQSSAVVETEDKIEPARAASAEGTVNLQALPTHQPGESGGLVDYQSFSKAESGECLEDVIATHSHQDGGGQEAESTMPGMSAATNFESSQLEYEDLIPQTVSLELEDPEQHKSTPVEFESQESFSILEYADMELQGSVPLVLEGCKEQHMSLQELEYEDSVSKASAFTAQSIGDPQNYTELGQRASDLDPPSASLEFGTPKVEASPTDLGSGGPPSTHHRTGNDPEKSLEDLEWEAEHAFSTLANLTVSGAQQTPAEVKGEPAVPLSPASTPSSSSHLEFESRFESGNLRKAIQVRIEYVYFEHIDYYRYCRFGNMNMTSCSMLTSTPLTITNGFISKYPTTNQG